MSSIDKVRRALQGNRFKAMVQAMRKSSAAKQASDEMEAQLNGTMGTGISPPRRRSLFALGAGVVDADRKKHLRSEAVRAAANTNQALALRLLEGKSIGSGTPHAPSPSPRNRTSPRAVPIGKFADAFR